MRRLVTAILFSLLASAAAAQTTTIGALPNGTPDDTDRIETEHALGPVGQDITLLQLKNYIIEAFDTEAELETVLTDMANIIQAAEMDTEAELETLVAGLNFIIDTEIDTEAEFEALVAGLNFLTSTEGIQLSGGTLTGELVADDLGIEFTAGDTLTDCSTFAVTGGGIFYDDSEGTFKKCEDNVLSDLDTNTDTGNVRQAATDCTAETGGVVDEQCHEVDDNDLYVCESAPCNGSGWVLYAGSGIANVVEDVTPQLGADLDPNGFGIVGSGGLEVLGLSETALAVNEFEIANAASGNGPELRAIGDNTDINVEIVPKGTGVVSIAGSTASIQAGTGAGNLVLQAETASDDIQLTPDGTNGAQVDGADDVLKALGTGGIEASTSSWEHPNTGHWANLAAADDNQEIWVNGPDAVTVVNVGCHCAGTCSTPAEISFEDRAGNALTHTTLTCGTGTGVSSFVAVTSTGGLVAGEGLRFDVDNAVSPETDEYTIYFGYTRD